MVVMVKPDYSREGIYSMKTIPGANRIYEREGILLIEGDCLDVLPHLSGVDAVVTDPPYGIKMDRGVRGCGYDGFGNGIKRTPRRYAGDWDESRPDAKTFSAIINTGRAHIIWGGNYFSDLLPQSSKWLFWDKCQTMPTYSDGELAWTSLAGASTKQFTYNGSGLMAIEKDRAHPTQKPVALFIWCLSFLPDAQTILDPFLGSGTTAIACIRTGRKCIGIEREPKYFKIACERVEAELNQGDLFRRMP